MDCIFVSANKQHTFTIKTVPLCKGTNWHVTTVTESGYKYSFAQHTDARELFDRLNRKFPDAHFVSAYEAGFCGFSAHYALTELGFENIVVHAADIPTTGKEKAMKTDAVDSEKIAWALKRGELTGIYVKDKQYMDDTNLVRLRQRFVADLSRQKNRTKHLLYTQGVTFPERFSKNRTHWSRNFMSWLREEVELLSGEKRSLVLLCDQVENTRRAILAVTREIRRLSTSDKYKENYGLLSSVPGFGLSRRRKDKPWQQATRPADSRSQLGGDTERQGNGGILLQLLPEHEATQSDNKGGKKARMQGLRSPKD